jgi:putative tryptophan/tyrosine transport system substrate-binding protein
MPAVGFLSVAPSVSPAILSGMAEAGYVVGRNVRMEIRSATEARQLPDMAADLVRSRVAVILAITSAGALAAKAATSTIPIVFGIGDDPIRLGLVPSLNHPGGNLTGTTNNNVELEGKRFEMIHLLLPPDKTIAAIVNPNNPAAERQATDIRAAARILGRKVRVFQAGSGQKLDAVFVGADAYFGARRNQFLTLAAYEAIPALYSRREFAERVAWSAMALIATALSARKASMSGEFSMVRSRPIYPLCRRRGSNWSSICRPQKRSGSKFRRRFSHWPTR